MKRAISAIALLLATVSADPIESPLRVRLNQSLLKSIFRQQDQQLLNLFGDLKVADLPLSGGQTLKDVSFLFRPTSVDVEDYDFNLQMNFNTFVGIEGQDLTFVGKGKLVGADGEEIEDVEISGPITSMKLAYELGDAPVNSYIVKGKKFFIKEFTFAIGKEQTTVSGAVASTQADAIKSHVESELVQAVTAIKDDILSGNSGSIAHLPVMSLFPLVVLFYTTQASEKLDLSEKWVLYDFSPSSLAYLKSQRLDLLQEIPSTFRIIKKSETSNEESALQVIVDQNLINTFVNKFIAEQTVYSMREFMSKDPRMSLFRQLLTTTSAQMFMPSFKEEYGEGKAIDVVGTLSHDTFNNRIEDSDPSGFKIDSKGNFNLAVNVGVQVLVEKNPGEWDVAREIYATLSMKGKLFVKSPGLENKTLIFHPQGLALSTYKVFKQDEEQFLEQMVTLHLLTAQIEHISKSMGFTKQAFPLKKFKNPKELQCLGFNLTDVDVLVSDGYIQFNSNYIPVPFSKDAVCDLIRKTLADGPEKLLSKLRDSAPAAPDQSPARNTLEPAATPKLVDDAPVEEEEDHHEKIDVIEDL